MNALWAKRIILGMAIADVAVFGAWIGVEEVYRTGARIRLPVEGYDPRDLISGHYVRFRLLAAREAEQLMGSSPTPKPGATLTFCIENQGGLYHVTRLRQGDDPCKFLKATVGEYRRLDFGVDRYFVDERIANEVRFVTAGPDTYLVATVDDRGAVHSVDLVVNGNSLAPRR